MKSNTLKRHRYALNFHSIRNISSPEDSENDRKIYCGHAPIKSVLDLPTDENVRGYLVEAEGKQRRRSTSVHRAIRDTLLENPDNFCVLNSGIVIVARELEVDEKDKKIFIKDPSIINGAQTQGVLRDLNEEGNLPDVHIKFEIIVTEDENLIADTSIARNYQNDVMTISIVGRLGQLDELEESIHKVLPFVDLRKSETQWPSDDFIDTEKLLQVITALVPHQLWLKPGESDSPNKVYTYSAKARCLKDFQDIYTKAKDKSAADHLANKAVYEFFLDIAPQAYELYTKWKTHQGFSGTKLRSIEREGKRISEVPDGIVFPILSALAVFARKTRNGWKIDPPAIFRDEELIKAAKSVYMEIAGSDPQRMGKNRVCYSALLQISSIYKKLAA